MIDRIQKLISVKSIVTLTLTALFFVLAVRGDLNASDVLTIYTVVIGFYFGTQYEKKTTEDEETTTDEQDTGNTETTDEDARG